MEQFIRDVGALTQDEQLVRGVLTVTGAVLATALGAWRLVRGRHRTPQRAKVDVPEGTFVKMGPTEKDVGA